MTNPRGRPRNVDRPSPDASYQTTDPTAYVLSPDPDVIAAREKAAASAQAQRANFDERDAIDAREYGISLGAWKLMGDAARKEVIQDYNRRNQGASGTVMHTIKGGEMGGDIDAMADRYTRAVRELEQDAAEARQFTIMCRPIVQHPRWGLIHQDPGVVKVPRRQMGRNLTKGFTYNPEAKFIPDPTVVCDICLAKNVGEPFKGYPDEDNPSESIELEQHQNARHPDEFRARERQRSRVGQQDMHSLLTRQGDAIERLLSHMAQQQQQQQGT